MIDDRIEDEITTSNGGTEQSICFPLRTPRLAGLDSEDIRTQRSGAKALVMTK